ncbi:DUF1906 domain-containing protein [Rhodobacteraceae bacterium CCMM004]|nr:DUF1906 domain-containing protein [Rhodobacteraceae bacterium CCMM004]
MGGGGGFLPHRACDKALGPQATIRHSRAQSDERTAMRPIKPLALAAAAALVSALPAAGQVKKSDDHCRPASGVHMVDTSAIVTDEFLTKMQEVGVSTVARYYDYENETITGKRLRPEELPLIARYGMSVAVVFQHNNNKAATFQDWRNRGPADAREALKLAARMEQPQTSAIYFGVDGDFVGPPGRGAPFFTDDVIGYFEEINRVFYEENVGYTIGVYGSGETCFTLIGEGLAGFCWLSHSHGFTGTQDALSAGSWDIQQYLHGTCGGRAVDFNEFQSPDAFVGQWRPGD